MSLLGHPIVCTAHADKHHTSILSTDPSNMRHSDDDDDDDVGDGDDGGDE